MDGDSFLKGYLTGVALHSRVHVGGFEGLYTVSIPGVVAAMSVTGIESDVTWYADMAHVTALTRITADHAGTVTAAWGYDGERYTRPVPVETLLSLSPETVWTPGNGDLWFRFHLDEGAALANLVLTGFREEQGKL